MSRRGFTLFEAIIVCAVIGLLAAVAVAGNAHYRSGPLAGGDSAPLDKLAVQIFPTLADAEAAPGPESAAAAVVKETGSLYLFSPGDATPPDDVVVLSQTGGTEGRWIHQGDALTLAPLGSGDDAAHVARILWGNQAKRTVVLSPGNYAWQSPCFVPSGTKLFGSSATTITSSIVNDNSYVTAAFIAFGGVGVSTNPAADVHAGDSVITTTGDVGPVGTQILLVSPEFQLSARTIVSISIDNGVRSLTLDRAVLSDFATTDVIVAYDAPHDIVIDGRGMTMTGTGARFFEFIATRSCAFENTTLHVQSGVSMDLLASFDCGGLANTYQNMTVVVDPGATALAGLALESNERSRVVDSNVTGSAGLNYGIILYDTHDSEVRDSSVSGVGEAALAFLGDGDSIGSHGSRAIGGRYTGSRIGVLVNSGSSDTRLSELAADGNTHTGILIGGDGTTSKNTSLSNVSARNNGVVGLNVNMGAPGTRAVNLDVSSNGTSPDSGIGLWVGSTFDADNVTSEGGNGEHLILANAKQMRISHLNGVHTHNANVVSLLGAGNNYEITDSSLTCSQWSSGINAYDSNVAVGGTTISGAVIGVVVGPGGTVRVRRANDWDSTPYPMYVNGGGVFSQGTATLAADGDLASATVAWPTLTSIDQVHISVETAAGSPGAYQVEATPGVGFRITSSSPDDRSVVRWSIEG